MIKRIIIMISLTLFLTGCDKDRADQTISVSGAFALYPLAVKWQGEYMKIHPEIKIQVSAGGAGKGMADVLGGLVDIANISREVFQEEISRGALPFTVAKDAVIPTINIGNSSIASLHVRGVTKQECADIWINKTITRWNELPGLVSRKTINVYTRSDACGAAQVWAEYLGGVQDDLAGIGVYGDPGLAQAVVRDVDGVGYNNINFAYDPDTEKPVAGIQVLRIDFNGNGKIDAEEDFYETRGELIRAIIDGRFPSPPARNLYFVTKGLPEKKSTRDFIRWALTEGQKYISESGYIQVKEEERLQCLKLLSSD